MVVKTLQDLQKIIFNICFLDLCVFCHLCNNCKFFWSIYTKSIDFVTVISQVIQINKIGTVPFLLSSGIIIELYNIAYAPECNSNLIFLGKLCKSGILFYDNPTIMTLIRKKKVIIYAKQEQNLFILKLIIVRITMAIKTLKLRKIMTITGCRQLTYLVC